MSDTTTALESLEVTAVTDEMRQLLKAYPRILQDLITSTSQAFDEFLQPNVFELILDGAIAYREQSGRTTYMARLSLDYKPEVSALYCDGILTILKHKTTGLLFCGLPQSHSVFESAACLRMEFISPSNVR